MTEYTASDALSIGEWTVYPGRHCLIRSGCQVHVVPKVMQVLLHLAERPGEVVTREDLLAALWSDTTVNDEVVTRAISTLRQAFDDDFRHPAYVETLPKVGYRLIAQVRPLTLSPATPQATPKQPARHRRTWKVGALVVASLLLGLTVFQGLPLAERDAPVPLHQVPLTTLPGSEFDPALSPDGNRLAFAWLNDATAGATAPDLYVKVLGREAMLQLTDDPAWEVGPAWSPDGQQIAFIRYDPTGCAILLVPAGGGTEEYLGGCGQNRMGDLAWSQDGKYLAYSDIVAETQQYGLVLLDVATRMQRVLTRPNLPTDSWLADTDPAFSPDGREVAFIRKQHTTAQAIYVMAVEGGPLRRVSADRAQVEGLTWTADSQFIVFASGKTHNYRLWRVPRQGGSLARISEAYQGMRNPSAAVASAEERVVGETWLFDTDIWHAPMNEAGAFEPPAPLITATRLDNHVQSSPTGDRLAFLSDRTGHMEIWLANADGSAPEQLTDLQGTFSGPPRWSPDGTTLLFALRDKQGEGVYTIRTDGTHLQRFMDGPASYHAPDWSHDGRWIYFASDRDGTWRIWKKPYALQKPFASRQDLVAVTPAGGFVAQEARDGSSLYFTRLDTTGIWQVTPATPEPILVVQTRYRADTGSWTVTSRGLYFFAWSGDAPGVYRYDFATATTQAVAALEKTTLVVNTTLAVSPDEHWLFYTRMARRESDVMLLSAAL